MTGLLVPADRDSVADACRRIGDAEVLRHPSAPGRVLVVPAASLRPRDPGAAMDAHLTDRAARWRQATQETATS